MLMKKKTAKSLVKVGSVAALGYLAYQGYQNWQKNKQQEAVPQGAFEPAGLLAETHSRVILRTMIAAAASDGLIDETENKSSPVKAATTPKPPHGLPPNTPIRQR